MTPQQEAQLIKDVAELKRLLNALNRSATIPFLIDRAFRNRFELDKYPIVAQSVAQGLATAPLATIADPAGGATIDSQARSAINTLIDRLQALGLIS